MSNLDFTISCIVTFFSKKRTSLPNLNYEMYYPHIIIKGTESWYKLYGSKDVIFDKQVGANALPLYEAVDYFALQAGTEFFIMKGGNVVGEGIVKEIFQHKPHERK